MKTAADEYSLAAVFLLLHYKIKTVIMFMQRR